MIIIKSINEIDNISKSVVTIGNFDGVHKGHQVLIKKTVKFANENNLKSIVFTFENHPINYFKNKKIKNIITNSEKISKIKKLGVDILIMIPFDSYMTKISPLEFIKEILIDKLDAKKIIVGHDFTFARRKEGNIKILKEMSFKYRFDLEIVNSIDINDIRVSSTHIRQLVDNGDVDKVNNYLGYNFLIKGKIIKGKQLGRTIGFPTANIKINDNLLIPKKGVYVTSVYIDDNIYYGATNIGYNPTVKGESLSIETNILEFSEDIYGKIIKLEFLERIRDEKKFNSIDELKLQLKKDTDYIYKNYICKNK